MVPTNSFHSSPLLECGPTARADDLAILHLKRDLSVPTILRSTDELNEGYSEGKVTNTRFGSFPHSTLIGLPWGSQIRASAVDTGSRGRKGWGGKGKKRKRGDEEDPNPNGGEDQQKNPIEQKEAKEASTGFAHLLPPTPEIWTASLPHRTQVVYTPDYSYILHRIRARPGTVLIEAGAGSGSFTHAAARAVYNGPPPTTPNTPQRGHIYSYEFHTPRYESLQTELHSHALTPLITLTHRDVCTSGFLPPPPSPPTINATAIFLDLPAPWLALKHLTRTPPSPLSPTSSIHLCTFSPCIEQVTRTTAALRSLGWVEISMVEIAAKRVEVRRERVGLQEEGLRGVNDSPADVDEAVARLREFEGRESAYHRRENMDLEEGAEKPISKQQRLEGIRRAQEGRKLYKEGRLVHKSEGELKTHTSYLVFAVLPREWSEEDERAAQERWKGSVEGGEERGKLMWRKARKREARAKAGRNKAVEVEREERIGISSPQ
ncbi:tRNA (adenine-N(1)-)-methyltransferase catalytic subunit trm61 [Lecanora helva]